MNNGDLKKAFERRCENKRNSREENAVKCF